jgi:hypothetical protein
MKRSKGGVHPTAWINLKNMALSQKRQSQDTLYHHLHTTPRKETEVVVVVRAG